VEALSVTPFSARALDRGLSGVLVGLMRLWGEHLNRNDRAGDLKDNDPLMPEVFDKLAQRAENATHDKLSGDRVRDMLAKRRDEWLKRVHGQTDYRLTYQPDGGATVGLLESPSIKDWETFTCLQSLRDVEGTVDLILDQRPTGLKAE
jgi:hypothetical protein